MIIRVKVKPSSKKDLLEKIADGEFAASVKEHSEDGKANAKVIKLISKYFNVGFKNIEIKNPTSRKKIIEI